MDQRDEMAVLAPHEGRIELSGRLTKGFALRTPVAIRIWREGDEYVADAPGLNVYAFGPTRDDAIENLRVGIVEHYLRFEEVGSRLAAPAQAVADRLRAVVQRRSG